jgi:hypothetical protein
MRVCVIVTEEPKSALHGKPMKVMHVEVCLCVCVRVNVCVYMYVYACMCMANI